MIILPTNLSPLRYPGGKSKLSPLLRYIIENRVENNITTYIEPFAGGAGVALELLFSGTVDNIIINDYDKAIYSFWRAVTESPRRFINSIQERPVTIEEWYRQKEIYNTQKDKYSFELGFATFFLNRTNRSGILNAGPIGGYEQNGNYLIDARYNKDSLIDKVEQIIKHKKKIKIYNKDIRRFIELVISQHKINSFVYFDPPYYLKGKELYKNFFLPKDHKEIKDSIIQKVQCPWVMTYDNEISIAEIYQDFCIKKYELMYSLANKGKASELIIFSQENLCPSNEELSENAIKIFLS